MKISDLKGKNILIAGYGIEGKSAEKFILKNVKNAHIEIADAKDGENYLKNQDKYDLIIKSPGINKSKITGKYTTPTNLFFENIPKHIKTIGVTGSKGKSTTSSLINHILQNLGFKSALVGNIGTPMLDLLYEEYLKNIEYLVIELSSYQLDDIKTSPHIAVITSLFPEHIDYHRGCEAYYEAKKNIVKYQGKNDYFVYNPSFPLLKKWAEESSSKSFPYIEIDQKIETKLLGDHNKNNIRAALTVCKIYDFNMEKSVKAISSFKPLSHRLEYMGRYLGIDFYDDAISTTPESTIAALNALPETNTIFLGGLDRGYDFSKLAKSIEKSSVENIVFFPKSGEKIKEEILKVSTKKINFIDTDSMKNAVEFAFINTKKNKICLLSTASPSYSLWKNFIDKGDQFQKFIKQYK